MSLTATSVPAPGGSKKMRDKSSPTPSSSGSHPVPKLVSAGLAICIVASLAILLFVEMDRLVTGVVMLLSMVILLFARVPIGVSMGVPGLAAVYVLSGWPATERILGQQAFVSVASWSLSVIPMFVFMGLVLWRSGVTDGIFGAARAWVSWMPGGLAMTTNVAGAAMAASSGSTIGITYAVGRVGLPEMLKSGYDRRLAGGAVLVAGASGQLIPPSIQMVVYAGVAGVAVGPQLLAGFVPGILLALFSCALIGLIAMLWPSLAPRTRFEGSSRERVASLGYLWPVPVLVLIILGGLYGGFFTATEAGAAGAAVSLMIALSRTRPRDYWPVIRDSLIGTGSAVGAIFFILIGAAILNRAVIMSGVGAWLTNSLQGAQLSQWGFVALLVVIYLILGMFMEPVAMIVLTVPILMETVTSYDISAMWFGVFVVLMAELAILTPPVGILSYVVHRIGQDPSVTKYANLRLGDIFLAAAIFIPVALILVVLMTAFPQIVEWLPAQAN